MKHLIDDIKRHTPKSIPGYYYLKTQNIYIPFMKVTIECLTRKISELNLFFESVLKLIEISVTDINEIATSDWFLIALLKRPLLTWLASIISMLLKII